MARKTHEQFINEVYDLVGNEYTVLGKYIKNDEKLFIRHNKCGNEYEVTPTKFQQGRRCPNCNKFSPIKKTKKHVQDKLGDEYEVLGEYINTNTPILIKHKGCNREYSATPNNILNKNRKCPYCSGRYPIGLEEFKKRVFSLEKDNYTVISNSYINDKTKIKMIHKKCNKEFEVRPNDFLFKSSRCPYCNESKGEKFISNWLNENNIPFKSQYKHKSCKDKRELPFDFIVNYNGNKFLIEYDGEHHFEPIFGEENFKLTQKHDKIKNNWCKRNNINLLRIHYKDFNKIENILDNYLKTFNDYRKLIY